MKKKWIEQLSCVDDAYIIDATVFANMQKKRWRRSMALVAGIAGVLLLGAVMLFIPYRTTAMLLYRIFDPAHYELLVKIDPLVDKDSANTSLFTTILNLNQDNENEENNGHLHQFIGGNIHSEEAIISPSSYKEITDNQEEGVIEADYIKRSDNCIFYMYDNILYTYSIEQEASKLLDTYDLWDNRFTHEFGLSAFVLNNWDFYLSEDCTTLTAILNYYDSTKIASRIPWVEIITLDVTDPSNITKINSITTTGYYQSSRQVDGNLLLFTQVTKDANQVDYYDKSTYLPQTITSEGQLFWEANAITYPETASTLKYTVIQMFDAKTLDFKDGHAYLSYSDNIYVSGNHIYTSCTFTMNTYEEALITHEDATTVSCLAFDKDGFEPMGSCTVAGYLENQYSMDEYEGVLRMVTTLNGFHYVPVQEDGTIKVTEYTEFMNVSLYCIDVSSFSVIAEVQAFAPEDENVESVRFDGDKAYVCTVYTPGLKDPVFAFDLSDLNNITYVNTGVIEGYSYSLIDLKDNFVLGLGIGSNEDTIKIEMYKENEKQVESVCSYTLANVQFSRDYKAYYINREDCLLGFGYKEDDSTRPYYVLLHFDNEQLTEVVKTPLSGVLSKMRSVYIDKYLYMFGKDGAFEVEKVTLD